MPSAPCLPIRCNTPHRPPTPRWPPATVLLLPQHFPFSPPGRCFCSLPLLFLSTVGTPSVPRVHLPIPFRGRSLPSQTTQEPECGPLRCTQRPASADRCESGFLLRLAKAFSVAEAKHQGSENREGRTHERHNIELSCAAAVPSPHRLRECTSRTKRPLRSRHKITASLLHGDRVSSWSDNRSEHPIPVPSIGLRA
jgi:hypothetical protein